MAMASSAGTTRLRMASIPSHEVIGPWRAAPGAPHRPSCRPRPPAARPSPLARRALSLSTKRARAPRLILTRLGNQADASLGATLLSIKPRPNPIGAVLLAPLLGFAEDRLPPAPGEPALRAPGLVSLAIAFLFSLLLLA